LREELYDLRSNPGERHDRIHDSPEKRADLARVYARRQEPCADRSNDLGDALGKSEIEALRSLGYVW
jgi:hypothetical protein